MTSHTSPINVHFTHLTCEFDDAELCRFGSPHVNKKELGQQLLPKIQQRTASTKRELTLEFTRSQIICANEVFPEAVSADPLADLEIWDEWQQNIRRFPYPGLFSPLGIVEQASKATNSTSVGVLGEIMSALLSQAYIAPLVIVRPIRRWPDFIFRTANDCYAFVESKAFTGGPDGPADVLLRIPKTTIQECLNNAVSQLNADPFVSAWFAFTEIRQIDPLVLSVVFLELNAPEQRRAQTSRRFTPHAVIQGLAERVVSSNAARTTRRGYSTRRGTTLSRDELETIRDTVKDEANDELQRALHQAVPETLMDETAREVMNQAKRLVTKVKTGPNDAGRRLRSAKEFASEGQLGELRSIGEDRLYLVDLTTDQCELLKRDWKADWARSVEKWKTVAGTDFWRCSSAAVGLGRAGLQGEQTQSL